MTEARATHRYIATGGECFPDGEDPASIEELPAGYWDDYDLAGTKLRAKSAINRERDLRQAAGCTTALGTMQTDEQSRGLLNGAVVMAMLAKSAGAPFAIGWTMADNATIEHDADELIAAGVAVGQHVATCHATSVALKLAVDAAATLAAVDAIQWP